MLTTYLSIALAALGTDHVIDGRLFDHDGHHVAGAHLWISSQFTYPEDRDWEVIAEATSSEQGGFELTLPAKWIEASGVLRDLSVLVWKEGHGAFQASWAPDDVPAGVPFEPWLPPAASTEFMVEDEYGEPYRSARVYPTSLTYPDSGGGLPLAPLAWTGTSTVRIGRHRACDPPLPDEVDRRTDGGAGQRGAVHGDVGGS